MTATASDSVDRLAGRIAVVASFGALAGLVVSLVLIVEGQLWVGALGDVSAVSVGCVCVLYPASQYRFRHGGYGNLDSIILGILFSNAFLQSYEVIYNFTFALDPPSVIGTEARMIVLWAIMISPILLVRKQLRFRWPSATLLLLLALIWITWVLYGYPQYYLPSYYVLPTILKTQDAFHLSLWLNFGTKALLAALFVSLLEPQKALSALTTWLHDAAGAKQHRDSRPI
jgi:hypothetical protein